MTIEDKILLDKRNFFLHIEREHERHTAPPSPDRVNGAETSGLNPPPCWTAQHSGGRGRTARTTTHAGSAETKQEKTREGGSAMLESS